MDPSPSPPAPSSGHGVPSAVPSCRKHKSDDASFLEDVRNHIDEFLHASMEEHQSCLKNSLQKVLTAFFSTIPSSLTRIRLDSCVWIFSWSLLFVAKRNRHVRESVPFFRFFCERFVCLSNVLLLLVAISRLQPNNLYDMENKKEEPHVGRSKRL